MGDTFCSNFLANLLATLIGIAVGLPFALWLDRIARIRNEKDKKNEESARGKKILSLLLVELDDCIDSMNKFHEDMSEYFYPVRTESWRAFSDGGELQWINDPELVDNLSIAYSKINNYEFVLEKYYDTYFYLVPTNNLAMSKKQFQSVLIIRADAQKIALSVKEIVQGKLKNVAG